MEHSVVFEGIERIAITFHHVNRKTEETGRPMGITSFEEATAVITALNSIAGLRNLDRSLNKTRFLFVWFYNILILCLFNVVTLFTELYHFHRRPHNLERVVYMITQIVYSFSITCTIIQSWYHSKVSLGKPTRNTTLSRVELDQCNYDDYTLYKYIFFDSRRNRTTTNYKLNYRTVSYINWESIQDCRQRIVQLEKNIEGKG